MDCVCLSGSAISRKKIGLLVCSHLVRVLSTLGIAGDALSHAARIYRDQLVRAVMDQAYTATSGFSRPLVYHTEPVDDYSSADLFAETFVGW